MRPLLERAPLLLAALWWGALSALSFIAVPLAFAHFGAPALAGPYAARLFQWQCWLSLGCSLLLLFGLRTQEQARRWLPWLLLAALAALLQEFGIAPRILGARAAGESVALWHRIGTALVLAQWAGALRMLWLLSARR